MPAINVFAAMSGSSWALLVIGGLLCWVATSAAILGIYVSIRFYFDKKREEQAKQNPRKYGG
jgi:hypothetical protein